MSDENESALVRSVQTHDLIATVRRLNMELINQDKNHTQEISRLQNDLQRSKLETLELQRRIDVWTKEIDKLNVRLELISQIIGCR